MWVFLLVLKYRSCVLFHHGGKLNDGPQTLLWETDDGESAQQMGRVFGVFRIYDVPPKLFAVFNGTAQLF